MNLSEKINELAQLYKEQKNLITSEQGTKMALIEPLINALGYNTSDPKEICA